MSNRRYNQFIYNFHRKMVVLTAKWNVLATNGAGVTVTTSTAAGTFGAPNPANSSFGNGIQAVTGYSSSPASGNNYLSGTFGIQLSDNYLSYVGHDYSLAGPVTGSAILVSTGFTAGTLMQITALGTTTTAQWVQVGVPAGVTPAVGLVFQANTFGAGTGTGGAKVLASSNLTSIEAAGDPNYGLQPVGQSNGFNGGAGGTIFFNCWKTATLTQPTDGTIVWLRLYFLGQ